MHVRGAPRCLCHIVHEHQVHQSPSGGRTLACWAQLIAVSTFTAYLVQPAFIGVPC